MPRRVAAGHDFPLAVAICAAIVAAVLAGVSLAREGLPEPERVLSDPAALVPAGALAYVHVDLDTERDPVEQLALTAERFPSYTGLRDRIVRELASPDCDRATRALETARDAALAFYEGKQGSALSLLLIDQGGVRPARDEARCGVLRAANIDRYLAIGQPAALADASRLAAGGRRSLASSPVASGQRERLPADAVADGWLSVDGVRRLLAPQRGALGLVGTVVDQPRLRGLAFAVSPAENGARVSLRSALRPGRGDAGAQGDVGELLQQLPGGALAAIAVPRLRSSLDRLSGAAGAAIGSRLLADLPGDVAALFNRPTLVVLADRGPVPVLSIITTTDDERAARRALARMSPDLRRQFPSRVKSGTVVLATRRSGLALGAAGQRLIDTRAWRATIGDEPPGTGGSLLFLDFSKLLALAERTGLDADASYRSVREDLGRIVAAGARISSEPSESTVDLTLLIS